MSQEWMIDVLTDLKKFAHQNGLMELAEQLDDTLIVAATELKLDRQDGTLVPGHAKQDRCVLGALAAGNNI